MQNTTKINKKRIYLTVFFCLLFTILVFIYTVTYQVTRVTSMDSKEYHQAKEIYQNSQVYGS